MDVLEQSYKYGTTPLTPASYTHPLYTYLFGGRISHSLSPQINAILYRHAGAKWTYALSETSNADHFLATLQQPTCIGAAVTMPNKVAFMPLLDDLTDQARGIGAVNTVFIRLDKHRNRRYIGTNTDCLGVRDTLLKNSPGLDASTRNLPALVLGAGGAARSAIYALWTWFHPSEIYLVNRLKSEVDDLMSSLGTTVPGIRLVHVQSVRDALAVPGPRVVVGTVPDDVPREEGEILAWHICEAFLRAGSGTGSGTGSGRGEGTGRGAVLDMCYHPPRTRLVKAAESNGWETMLGTEVLVRVAAAQQTLWLEREPSAQGVDEALRAMQRLSSAASSKL